MNVYDHLQVDDWQVDGKLLPVTCPQPLHFTGQGRAQAGAESRERECQGLGWSESRWQVEGFS